LISTSAAKLLRAVPDCHKYFTTALFMAQGKWRKALLQELNSGFISIFIYRNDIMIKRIIEFRVG